MADATELAFLLGATTRRWRFPVVESGQSEHGNKVRRALSTPMIASFRKAVASAAGEPEAMDQGACLRPDHAKNFTSDLLTRREHEASWETELAIVN